MMFRVGDWVEWTDSISGKRVVCQIAKLGDTDFVDYRTLGATGVDGFIPIRRLSAWQPQVGDMCAGDTDPNSAHPNEHVRGALKSGGMTTVLVTMGDGQPRVITRSTLRPAEEQAPTAPPPAPGTDLYIPKEGERFRIVENHRLWSTLVPGDEFVEGKEVRSYRASHEEPWLCVKKGGAVHFVRAEPVVDAQREAPPAEAAAQPAVEDKASPPPPYVPRIGEWVKVVELFPNPPETITRAIKVGDIVTTEFGYAIEGGWLMLIGASYVARFSDWCRVAPADELDMLWLLRRERLRYAELVKRYRVEPRGAHDWEPPEDFEVPR